MNAKEAIRILHPDTTREALAEYEYYGGFNGKQAMIKAEDASLLACEALEKQIAKEEAEKALAKLSEVEQVKAKVEMHPKVKLVVDVNKKMKADFLECKEMAMTETGKDCSKCSWNELRIDSTGICELIGVEEMEKQV